MKFDDIDVTSGVFMVRPLLHQFTCPTCACTVYILSLMDIEAFMGSLHLSRASREDVDQEPVCVLLGAAIDSVAVGVPIISRYGVHFPVYVSMPPEHLLLEHLLSVFSIDAMGLRRDMFYLQRYLSFTLNI